MGDWSVGDDVVLYDFRFAFRRRVTKAGRKYLVADGDEFIIDPYPCQSRVGNTVLFRLEDWERRRKLEGLARDMVTASKRLAWDMGPERRHAVTAELRRILAELEDGE